MFFVALVVLSCSYLTQKSKPIFMVETSFSALVQADQA
jgi:hypothetical protein